MKVERSRGRKGSLSGSFPTSERVAPNEPVFQEVLGETIARRRVDLMDVDLETVDRYAAALRESPTMKNLRNYREAIRSFLSALLDAYAVEEVRGFTRYGKRSISILVRTVDAKLEELALTVLHNAQDTLEIAARIDDIRGLLLDYMR